MQIDSTSSNVEVNSEEAINKYSMATRIRILFFLVIVGWLLTWAAIRFILQLVRQAGF